MDLSVDQASDPKPIDFIKPKLNSAPSVGHNPNPKPSGHEVDPPIDQASNPKPIDFIKPKPNSAPSVSQNPNPKPSGHYKPKHKHKPALKRKPKKSQPLLTQSHTHPRSKFSSPVPPSHLFSPTPSIADSDQSDTMLSLTHMELTCTEKCPSVLDNSDASVTESMCSDASVDESLCSNGDVALQRDIQQIIHEHTDNVIKKWGNSE